MKRNDHPRVKELLGVHAGPRPESPQPAFNPLMEDAADPLIVLSHDEDATLPHWRPALTHEPAEELTSPLTAQIEQLEKELEGIGHNVSGPVVGASAVPKLKVMCVSVWL